MIELIQRKAHLVVLRLEAPKICTSYGIAKGLSVNLIPKCCLTIGNIDSMVFFLTNDVLLALKTEDWVP